MPMLADIRNALAYLGRGEFREFLFRLRAHFSGIDLRYASVGELGLSSERSHDYRHSGGVHLERVLDSLNVTGSDAIVDFGSGKGGALITFARYPFARITGVELMPGLAAIAENNLRLFGITTVDMVVSDAAAFTDLDGYTFFYFYSPFPRPVMEAVIGNIGDSLRSAPRRAHLIYCNPEFHDILDNGALFRKTAEFPHRQLHLPIYVYTHEP